MPAGRSAAVRASSCCRAEAARPSSDGLHGVGAGFDAHPGPERHSRAGNGKLNCLTRRRWSKRDVGEYNGANKEVRPVTIATLSNPHPPVEQGW